MQLIFRPKVEGEQGSFRPPLRGRMRGSAGRDQHSSFVEYHGFLALLNSPLLLLHARRAGYQRSRIEPFCPAE